MDIKYTKPTGIKLGTATPTSIPILQSTAPSAQGSSMLLQGSSPNLQGSSIPVQSTVSPMILDSIATGNIAADGSGTAPASGVTDYPDLTGVIEMLRQNFNSLDPLYQTDVARAIEAYDIAMNERGTNFNKAKASNESSSIKNDQTVLNSRNAINKNARMSAEDILSILGAMGMGGSTRIKALGTLADKSNTNMNEANYGYGQNKQNLLQSWNDFVNEDANQQKQIADTKEYSIAEAGIKRDTGKKNILQQIASNKIEMGQGISDINAEMAGLDKNIADLSGVKKTYTGITPTYTAPAISDILGQNMARFDVGVDSKSGRKVPKLIKVNEQTGSGDRYGLE